MRILFVTHSAFLPEVARGQERNTDQLCRAMKRLGHQPAVIAGLISNGPTGKWASLRLRFGDPARPVVDHVRGYPIYRSWDVDTAFDATVDDFKPDVVVVQSWLRTVERCHELGLPVAYYVHAANDPIDPGSEEMRRNTLWLTVSRFSALHNGGPSKLGFHVIPPLVEPALYRVRRHHPFHATFIGLQSFKGGELVVKLAQVCPEIPFLIFDNVDRNLPQWPGMSGAELRAAVDALPNVKVQPAAKTATALYGSTKVLLSPSRCYETWGRVASEAQVNGIPVLASDRGGLPEAVGLGGVCLDYDAPIAVWVETLHRMWNDKKYYAELSALARLHAARADYQPDALIGRFVDLLEALAAGVVVPARLPDPGMKSNEIATAS